MLSHFSGKPYKRADAIRCRRETNTSETNSESSRNGVEPNMDIVPKARRVGCAEGRAAAVNVVLPLVELSVGLEGEVELLVASCEQEAGRLEVCPLDVGNVAKVHNCGVRCNLITISNVQGTYAGKTTLDFLMKSVWSMRTRYFFAHLSLPKLAKPSSFIETSPSLTKIDDGALRALP